MDARVTDCPHLERVEGICSACGHCLHEVVLNGACFYCGINDLDPIESSPTPTADFVPATRLGKRREEE